MTFNVGDMVVYEADGHRGRPQWNGSTGMITHHFGITQVRIRWDTGPASMTYDKSKDRPIHYIDNLKPLEIPYDPKQQADQDDDI